MWWSTSSYNRKMVSRTAWRILQHWVQIACSVLAVIYLTGGIIHRTVGYRNKLHILSYILCFISSRYMSESQNTNVETLLSKHPAYLHVISYFLHSLYESFQIHKTVHFSLRSLSSYYLIVVTLYKCPLPIPPSCTSYYQFHEFSCHISVYNHFSNH